jgi:PAS domain-containing protein
MKTPPPDSVLGDKEEILALKQQLADRDAEISRLKAKLYCQGDYGDSSATKYPKDLRRVVVQECSDIQTMNVGGFAHQLLDAAPIQVYVKDIDRRYVYLNARARTLLGADGQDPIGISDSELVTNRNELHLFRQEDSLVIENCEKRSIEEDWTPRHPDEDGGFRKIRTTRYPIVLAAEPTKAIGVVSICEDRTFFTRQRLLSEVVTLINHDWVNGVITNLCLKLRAVLLAALKSPDERISERARNLLSIGHDIRDSAASVSSEDVSRMENVTIEVIELAFRQFIPVHFMNAYLSHLAFYETSASGDTMQLRSAVNAIRIREQVLQYMSVFAACAGQFESHDAKLVTELTLNSPDEVECVANVDVLRIMVFQQLRNHQRYGSPQTPLILSLVDDGEFFALVFDSEGEPIPAPWIPRLGRKMGVRVPKVDADGYPVNAGGVGFGLYYCGTVAESAGGAWNIERCGAYNRFIYRMRKVT